MSRNIPLLGLAMLLILCLISRSVAVAQQGPAGNTHPATRDVSTAGDPQNLNPQPFGMRADADVAATVEQKSAFAASVDLSPLRGAAVFHNGRVKVLDTLADETVQVIAGRREYRDVVPGEKPGSWRNVPYEPMFTLFDLVIDPGYYLDKPLVHAEFLPLREDFLERAYPDANDAEWWKRQGRLPPRVISAHFDAIRAEMEFEPGYRPALGKVARGMNVYAHAGDNLLLVAPATLADPWTHLSSLRPDHPAAVAARALGESWRRLDANEVNSAARQLADALATINPSTHPSDRLAWELRYNSVNPFEYGFWAYFVALVALLIAFGTGRRWLVATGVAILLGALALHAFGFIARCLVAERFAIQNQYESMTGLSLGATIVGVALMAVRRQWLFGAAAAGVGFMVLLTATQARIPGGSVEREAAILNTSWLLKYHVTTVLVSYGLISLGFMLSLFHLATYYIAGRRGSTHAASLDAADEDQRGFVAASAGALGLGPAEPTGVHRVLKDLDSAQMIVLQLAFWTLGVGILLGAWWADHSWGRWWAFDPKELWALITWIVYLIVIHLRFTITGPNRALTTAWLSVVGFFVMLWTYFGVNLLLAGLHAYA